jgi:hypothetical protein
MTMSSATPTPQDSGLPAPATPYKSSPLVPDSSSKPTILHLGDDIRWNHDLYASLNEKFNITRTYSMGREEFKIALKEKKWGDFVGMYRPFWNTGGEMGNWDAELMSVFPFIPTSSNINFECNAAVILTISATFSQTPAKSTPPPAQASTGSTRTLSPYTAAYTAIQLPHAPSPSPTPQSC